MSLTSAEDFLKKFKEDKVFRASVVNAPNNEARQKTVTGAGYKFSPHEVMQAMGKLSPDEFNLVASNDTAQAAGAGAAAGAASAGAAAW
jgi:predicted ribosomally synthesized peptide with nif11-like leader